MISIGNDFGGPEQEDSHVRLVLHKALNLAADLRPANYDDGTTPWLNAVFIVPGSVYKPEFSGLKLGHFSRKRKGLVVMIAAPESVSRGEAVPEFVVASLKQSVQVAGTYFQSKGMHFPLEDAERIIAKIEANLMSGSACVH